MKRLVEGIAVLDDEDRDKVYKVIAGSIAYKYSSNYGMDKEDLEQELLSTVYTKFPDATYDWVTKNRALVNKVMEDRSKDLLDYKAVRDRRDSGISINRDNIDTYTVDKDSDVALAIMSGSKTGKVGKNSIKSIDAYDEVRDMYRIISKRYGKYSYEVRGFIGFCAMEGELEALKNTISKEDYREAQAIKNKNDIGEYMDPDEPLKTDGGAYKKALNNMRSTLKSAGY